MNADSIRIETDEDGFWLVIDVPNFANELELVRFRISDPEALYDHVKAVIGPWLRERYEARATTSYDVREAYDISDPKHPHYHSTHADIWDAREGK